MDSDQEIFTLDLGTTKFCLGYVGIPENMATNQKPHFDFLLAPSAGFKKGMLVNFQEAKVKLKGLIQNAEQRLGKSINRVVLGIAGHHLRSRIVHSEVQLDGGIVVQETLHRLRNLAEKQRTEHREILHTIPIFYKIDDRPSDDAPLGLSGQFIRSSFLLIEADRFYVRDIVHLCNEIGLEVAKLYCEAYASSSVIANSDQKTHGCVIMDIGGGSTDAIIYHGGKPKGIFTLNIGGQHMTNDLSIGLNLPWAEAEQVKTFFGLKSDLSDDSRITVRNIHGELKSISLLQVYPILRPRIEELALQTKRKLHQILPAMKSGILLTGGGSRLEGIADIFTTILASDVRILTPTFGDASAPASGDDGGGFSGTYATSLGMMYLEFQDITKSAKPAPNGAATRYWRKFVRLVKDLS